MQSKNTKYWYLYLAVSTLNEEGNTSHDFLQERKVVDTEEEVKHSSDDR